MYLSLLLFGLGLLGLWFGSDIVVSAARKFAKALNISELVIGLTVVSVGTTLPEIATTMAAGVSGRMGIDASGIAIGDIIGSNMANITFILGICGLFVTFAITKKALARDGIVMLAAILAMFLAFMDLKITKQEGVALIFLYMLYFFYLGKQEGVFLKFARKENKLPILGNVLLIMTGVAVLVFSSGLVVKNGVALSGVFGVNEFIVGLFVGLGTSLPELTVSLAAVLRGAGSLSLGNLIGSSIINPTLALGSGAVISGFILAKHTLFFDFPFLFISTLLVLALLNRNLNLGKSESVLIIGVYLLYMASRILFFGV